MKMNSNSDTNYDNMFAFMPRSALCYDFIQDTKRLRKTAWLVPHVIKHKDDTELISWRCNWGSVCSSDCIYAMAKEKIHAVPAQEHVLS
jgi:hypothetical protein